MPPRIPVMVHCNVAEIDRFWGVFFSDERFPFYHYHSFPCPLISASSSPKREGKKSFLRWEENINMTKKILMACLETHQCMIMSSFFTHLSGDFNVFLPCCQMSNESVHLVSWYPSDLGCHRQLDDQYRYPKNNTETI